MYLAFDSLLLGSVNEYSKENRHLLITCITISAFCSHALNISAKSVFINGILAKSLDYHLLDSLPIYNGCRAAAGRSLSWYETSEKWHINEGHNMYLYNSLYASPINMQTKKYLSVGGERLYKPGPKSSLPKG